MCNVQDYRSVQEWTQSMANPIAFKGICLGIDRIVVSKYHTGYPTHNFIMDKMNLEEKARQLYEESVLIPLIMITQHVSRDP